ncbi:MAG: hypothetical protein LBI03_05915 [Clostridiales bacterium]|jgi:hypothetical protein|nr:hypothetical protein [Clostridiales bacterium]
MFDNEAMFKEWVSQLLERNNVSDVKELTLEMIDEEIEDTRSGIKNEKLWALGSSGRTAAMHSNNAEVMCEYVKYLELLPPMHDLELVLGIYMNPDELPERIIFRVPEAVTMEKLREVLISVKDLICQQNTCDYLEESFERVLNDTCAQIGQKSYWRKANLESLAKKEDIWEMEK